MKVASTSSSSRSITVYENKCVSQFLCLHSWFPDDQPSIKSPSDKPLLLSSLNFDHPTLQSFRSQHFFFDTTARSMRDPESAYGYRNSKTISHDLGCAMKTRSCSRFTYPDTSDLTSCLMPTPQGSNNLSRLCFQAANHAIVSIHKYASSTRAPNYLRR